MSKMQPPSLNWLGLLLHQILFGPTGCQIDTSKAQPYGLLPPQNQGHVFGEESKALLNKFITVINGLLGTASPLMFGLIAGPWINPLLLSSTSYLFLRTSTSPLSGMAATGGSPS